MKAFAFFFRYSRSQRKGVLALFLLIILIQAGYFIYTTLSTMPVKDGKGKEETEWLAQQSRIDELKAAQKGNNYVLYPFNPNFVTDYKGYTLGMTVAEIDRLHNFRKKNKYVNSAKEFQQVTKISDSLLSAISPYFKFPDWVTEKNRNAVAAGAGTAGNNKAIVYQSKEVQVVQLDINDAFEEDLVKVYGIGPAFAKKILRRRAQLGAYVSMEQMDDFTDFSAEAQSGLKKHFTIGASPEVSRINVNTASLNQLTFFPYFNKGIAKSIITERSMKGKITNIEELLKNNGFTVDKVNIIALYLEF